jgi:hypothetical protein
MPETVRVMSFIEVPHRRWWRWTGLLVDRALKTLECGGTDLQVLGIPKIPGDAFRAKVPVFLNHLGCARFGRGRQSPARDRRRCTLGHTRQTVALAHPLNGTRTWGLCPELLVKLVGTQGRMTLTQGHHALL